MVYTGYRSADPSRNGYAFVDSPRVGLAWSEDLLHWERDSAEPMYAGSGLPGGPDSAGATGPFLWPEGDRYLLFYFGVTRDGYEQGEKTLNIASSRDLTNWIPYEGNPVITPGGNGWRRDAIWHPNVVRKGHTYYLFFNASGISGGTEEEFIGFATSRDLLHWTVQDAHSPVLVGSREPGRWDSTGRTGDPSLFPYNDLWVMAYYSWNGVNAQDGLAWTTDREFPLGWRPFHGNPVLRIGSADSFDALHAAKPFIIHTNERHYHFYTAVDGAERREIALAVWPDVTLQG
jgi:predicted GH43/DUF377 family glycosyl hydrolase